MVVPTEPGKPVFDAVVLAGGRSSRLGGTPKASLHSAGQPLLAITCRAAGSARRITVVGPVPPQGLQPGVRFIRESPPFGGPAAALAAAVVLFDDRTAPWQLVLACDMPGIAGALPALFAAAAADPGVSVQARENGRDQALAALYRSDDLRTAVARVHAAGGATNLSLRALLASVQSKAVEVPPGSTRDVDTWEDARALGIEAP